MYTLKRAAQLLGVSRVTVQNWMKKCGIKGRKLRTDRTRVHLSRNEMIALIGELERRMTKKRKRRRTKVGENLGVMGEDNKAGTGQRQALSDHSPYEKAKEDFYSLTSAASFLGVSVVTVRKWVAKHNIEMSLMSTDRKRRYMSRDSLLMLTNLHGRKAEERVSADIVIKREEGALREEDENKWYSLVEVALYLNISDSRVKHWIRMHNIEKKVVTTDRKRVYISYKDVLMLAELHQRKVTPNISPLNVAEELKELRSKVSELTADVEDIKHDFRVYVERSIYIG
jgi:uncharacterized protein YjcR